MSLPEIRMSDADIGDDEHQLVSQVIRSRALSCGSMLEQFEHEWGRRLGRRFSVGVSSGTAGLHLALVAAGVGDFDCVITSPYSFIASANAILYQRAVPVFVDVDPMTLNVDPAGVADAIGDLQAGRTSPWIPRRGVPQANHGVRAILPVHVFGQPAAMPAIMDAASVFDIPVIEDACEAVDAEHLGRRVGTFGDAAVYGFFPNKQMTMGEGGIVVTDREDWAPLFRSLRNQGRGESGAHLHHVRLGYNYRLDELSAAVGLAQLRRLDALLEARARVAARYTASLSIPGVQPMTVAPSTTRMSWFVYVVRLAPEIDRDAVMSALQNEGIPSRPYFPPIHLQPFYRERFGFREGDFPHAEAAGRSTLALPFHGRMPDGDVDRVVESLARAVVSARRPRRAGAVA